jgi:uncharacterized protein (DUF885 family)
MKRSKKMSLVKTRAGVAGALAVGLVLALPGCEISGDGALPGEDRVVEDIMETYVSARFRFYPVESTLSGLPGNDDRLGDFSRASIDERIQWLTDFHYKLLGLKLTALSQPAYLDALWLTSLVKAELFELEVRSVWRRSASFYGDAARLGLVTLLAEGELASRTDALGARLAEIPVLFGQARENLEPAASVWDADARASLDACGRLLEDLPKIIEGRLPPHRVAELAGLSRDATRAIQDLLAAPPELQAGQTPLGFALGEEELERYFFYRHMVDWSLDEIALEAERELQAATNALAELALERFPSKSLQAVLDPEPLAVPIETAVVAAESRALAFLRERDGASPLDASIPVRRVPAYFPGSEVVQLWRPKALEPARGAFLMVHDVAVPDAFELELLTLREIGGRARQYAFQAGSTSLLRRVVSAPATREGWLARFERDVLADPSHQDSHELRIEHYQRAIVDFTRLLAQIGVHAHGQDVDGAAELFRERAFMSDAAARAEAARVAVDLRVGDAAIGRLLLDELAAEYYRAYPLEPRSVFDDRVVEDGFLPVRLLRFRMLP